MEKKQLDKWLLPIAIILLAVMVTIMALILIKLNSFQGACEVCEEVYGKMCLNWSLP